MAVLRKKPQGSCLGCLGSLVGAVVVPAIIFVLIAPWIFHIGERWTLGQWDGVGRLRDSAGLQYGVYLRLYPYVNIDHRNEGMSACCNLGGRAQVCTAGGAKYRFDLNGFIHGAWLHTEGSKVNLSLMELGRPKLPRQFDLFGVWRGPSLVLDDRKSMFIHFLPGGNLTPSPNYTSPVPDRHATVTLAWGSLGDFETICAGLGGPTRGSSH
jgi:hypothetical protein